MDFLDTLTPYLPQEEIDSLLLAMEEKETVHALLLNPRKMSEEEFLSRFPRVTPHPFVPHAFLYSKSDYEFGKMLEYEIGCFSIQDPSSMMVAHFLAIEKGDVVLDLCAAPGGKTIGAALAMEEQGIIVANDISYARAKDLSSNIERMGIGNVIVTSNDFKNHASSFASCFDKIILDAPCSGSAMFRKNELAKKQWNESKLSFCVKQQQDLLEEAALMLKEGGRIAYSTCSFSYEENEGIILPFLDKHPEFHLVNLPSHSSFYRSQLLPEAIHFFPHRFEGEGQFLCLLEKDGERKKTEFPASTTPSSLRTFVEKYHLEARSNFIHNEALYSLPYSFQTRKLHVLRFGLKAADIKDNRFTPSHHLSLYLDAKDSIPLNEKQAKLYLHGDSFPLEGKEGFVLLSYQNRNLGFAKITNGIAKNFYPKGKRRQY